MFSFLRKIAVKIQTVVTDVANVLAQWPQSLPLLLSAGAGLLAYFGWHVSAAKLGVILIAVEAILRALTAAGVRAVAAKPAAKK